VHIVWFSWKDNSHPLAGGAEVVSGEIRKRLVKNGHRVTLITARYNGSSIHESIDGIDIIRTGGRYSVYWKAKQAYQQLNGSVHLVIDEMNTIPFFTASYAKDIPNILLTYQLARVVWFYQIIFPLSLIGYILEPMYLRFLSNKYNRVLTESESTKTDLVKYGFMQSKIDIFPVGIEIKPINSIPTKPLSNSILFLGALRPMKRPLDAIKAFEVARDDNHELHLVIAGSASGKHGEKVMSYIHKSRHSDAIELKGRVSSMEKINLLGKADIILITSIKEGWGLIATEANSQGTPAIAYDAAGLRDSVLDGTTGFLVKSGDFRAMGQGINTLLRNKDLLRKVRSQALQNSKKFTFKNSYKVFMESLSSIYSSEN
jgi:glycosyltransferase involved in cell wall biosynthesis